jgi:hypothetical protein
MGGRIRDSRGAAKHGRPAGITHVVETRHKPGGEVAYVLLAIEVNPPGFYLDENLTAGFR